MEASTDDSPPETMIQKSHPIRRMKLIFYS